MHINITPILLTCAICENSFAMQPMARAFIYQLGDNPPKLICEKCGASIFYAVQATEAKKEKSE